MVESLLTERYVGFVSFKPKRDYISVLVNGVEKETCDFNEQAETEDRYKEEGYCICN